MAPAPQSPTYSNKEDTIEMKEVYTISSALYNMHDVC